MRSVARSTRPSLSVIVPEEASTEATVPVASTDDVLLVPEPGGDKGGGAVPATWRLLTSPLTPLTPLTPPASCAARERFS